MLGNEIGVELTVTVVVHLDGENLRRMISHERLHGRSCRLFDDETPPPRRRENRLFLLHLRPALLLAKNQQRCPPIRRQAKHRRGRCAGKRHRGKIQGICRGRS